MRNLNKKSIAIKLSAIMLIVIILQSFVIVGSVFMSGIFSGMNDNAYESFSKTVENRKNYLQNEMIYRWSNIESFTTEIEQLHGDLPGNDKESINNFLEKAAPILTNMIRSTMSTGGFVILDGGSTAGEIRNCIYLKDYDPVLNNKLNKDIYMLKGPKEVAQNLQIPLEKNWNYGLTLDVDSKDIYEKPYFAAKEGIPQEFSGYWSVSPNIAGKKNSMLTYTYPLMDKNNQVFGVIGVEITQDYIAKFLPDEEIAINELSGYMLGKYDKKNNELLPGIIPEHMINRVAAANIPIKFDKKNNKINVNRITNAKLDEKVYCHRAVLNLYKNNTPFENDVWCIVGSIDKENLFSFTKKFERSLYFAVIFSMVFGVMIAFFVGLNFVQPILKLAKNVRRNDAESIISFKRTGLFEIDELAVAIENLNKNIVEKSLKTDKILNMVNLPIGAFEYDNKTNYVNCSAIVMDLFHLKKEKNQNNNVDKDVFFSKLMEIEKNVEDAEKKIYTLEKNPSKWVKISMVENENGILGVAMDVTRDVLEKYSIKFERDYDALSGIYNRNAFKREAQIVFERGIVGFAAFVMFDLDNLKYVNDTYGHEMGDTYIKSAAAAISNHFQKNAVVGRMSGDEFYVFTYNKRSKDEIREILHEFYRSLDINTILLPNGNEFKMRMSGGLAWYGEHSINYDELARFADFAMYEGKHSVKGEIREFNRADFETGSFMLSGREELNRVLDNQLIEFAFQPIISAKTGEIYAYESLMRPESEILTNPTKLLQIAASQSKLWNIEKIAFFKTLATYIRYEKQFKGCKIFINSVPNEVLKDEEYREIEEVYGSILDRIVVEIIENEKQDAKTLQFKKDLVASWGGAIALDDYGAGYNSDISLLSISPQIIKIDKGMIDNICTDTNRQSIVQKIMIYAKERNILTLAEGVESKEQMEYLMKIDIDLLQGYYIARPNFVPNFNNQKIKKEINEILGSKMSRS